ncbi:MAG: hypothetical protein COU46_03545 [Candidatus Niyogibacteria bacterium CG10_big_fil_rev_8_21_14_0_10_42_19]|uniref:Bacterial type II secretion system protein E domain-containing protein n=1 Tax=Candidatus Niyogibacteria bacterium CG10_big_fil_rev_8_21_14_0_10_42_19 TaxID=1974725 RepID=A0A2H0TES3_9BACT|nr:MAG: hypothetical protein COU46_03545 [Candidatus Niyogibacteria bacterium CG10_big_fil_rev_8_21_14_0_10_42_19]
MNDSQLLNILVSKKVLEPADVDQIVTEAASREISVEEALREKGVSEDFITEAKAELMGFPQKSLGGKPPPLDILRYIPEESARYYKMIPLGIIDGALEVGMLDPANLEAREAVQFIASKFSLPLKVYLISETDFETALTGYKSLGGEVSGVLGELETALSDETPVSEIKTESEETFIEKTPVTRMVAVILRHATEGRASDIHIEPSRNKLRVRFRVDGVLYTSLLLPITVHDAIVSRVKILTNLQLDEKRKPQDGRFSASISGRIIDFRVSTFPTSFGEKVAIRILDSEKGVKSFVDLGLSGRNLEVVEREIKRPYGLILVTGPTGSGKSTTLYAMMQILNQEASNVISLEDPIEYNIEGINQSQVRPEIGYDFASGLRSILRQDPDIMMVGEIRDKETAQLAIHAALTGHLVLSTLHTNNAIGVIPRLIDMGVDPFLIAPTLVLAIGQRLVRTLCPDSKGELVVEGQLKEALEKDIGEIPEGIRKKLKSPKIIYQPKPSATCPRGTFGRIAVFEVLAMTKELEHIVLTQPVPENIEKEARRQGMITMREDGILKVLEGKIGYEELASVSQTTFKDIIS